jgi:hypothetical protein
MVFVVAVGLAIGLMRSLGCVVTGFYVIASGFCVFVLSVAVRGVQGLFMVNAWFDQFSRLQACNKKGTNEIGE